VVGLGLILAPVPVLVVEDEVEEEVVFEAGEVGVDEALLAVVVALVAEEVKVTPTAAQSPWETLMALVRSAPVQAFSMQVVVLLTKAGLVHRQWVSVWPQVPRSAEAMHGLAQSGYGLWRAMSEEADAEAAAPKRVNATVEKRIMVRG